MPLSLPPDYDAFRAAVLSDQGDDHQGVYEVWWQANSWYPDQPVSTRLAIAEAVVTDLLREERIRLVRGEWIGPGHPCEPVTDVDAALRDWATWVPQPGVPVVWLAET
ncbi:hypothetical protein BH11ACT8_BH11ACT8_05220 [soil metagenome]